MTIMQGFSQHVRNNAEALRHKLVKHAEGKVEIAIAMDDLFLNSPENAWHEAIEMLALGLRSEIGDMFDSLMCDFSTTGPRRLSTLLGRVSPDSALGKSTEVLISPKGSGRVRAPRPRRMGSFSESRRPTA